MVSRTNTTVMRRYPHECFFGFRIMFSYADRRWSSAVGQGGWKAQRGHAEHDFTGDARIRVQTMARRRLRGVPCGLSIHVRGRARQRVVNSDSEATVADRERLTRRLRIFTTRSAVPRRRPASWHRQIDRCSETSNAIVSDSNHVSWASGNGSLGTHTTRVPGSRPRRVNA
jgi:hypothetical protein